MGNGLILVFLTKVVEYTRLPPYDIFMDKDGRIIKNNYDEKFKFVLFSENT